MNLHVTPLVSKRYPSVPVELVTGFLGSGKTTLINAVINNHAFAGALVVVNEFGEIGLDHVLVSSAQDQVVLLPSGCLCCAASGSLRDTLIEIFASKSSGRLDFDRIIVETSGLANPGPLIATLLGDSALRPRCHLAGILTLVDAINGTDTLAQHEEARQQVALADRLLVSKSELSVAQSMTVLLAQLRTLNPHAPIEVGHPAQDAIRHLVDIEHGPMPQPIQLINRLGSDLVKLSANPGKNHGSDYRSIITCSLILPEQWSWESYARLIQVLGRQLGKRLLRCKGLLALGETESPSVIQGVQGYFAPPEKLSAWPEQVPRGYLVCIALGVSADEIEALILPLVTTYERLTT